ncbi:unnamed protein product [Clonostachys rosea f. rosea IK726]|uniref:Kinetochore protein fta4 n=2 Tax=Bionectria ochroleuca TaxID=29856 RepID=A0A8H7NCA1_BIOOC|nr:unnamed protein product [Clonostachys rosea f. rosea IK726]
MSTAPPPPTITQLKERFISRQIHLLSSPVDVSTTFRTANNRADKPLEPRLLEAAVAYVDNTVQEHCRRIFVPQATRAVSEQINDSYTKEAERKLQREQDDEDGVGKELDLSDPEVIESLPSTWSSEKEANKQPAEAKRYSDGVQSLTDLNAQRKEVKLRVERLRRLKALIAPLRTQDGGAGVQENLATRNGALEKELERTRMLLLRVAGRVERLSDSGEGPGREVQKESIPTNVLRKRTVEEFLADPKVFPNKK